MYVVYDLGTEGIPRYSWNTAKVGIKHQSINGTRSTHVGMVWINRMVLWVVWFYLLTNHKYMSVINIIGVKYHH